jgi:hypothetical protein
MSEGMDSGTKKLVEIHVRLLDEGTEVSRPTFALDLGNGLFKIEATTDYDPQLETWEFLPGSVVGSELRWDESGQYRIAVEPILAASEQLPKGHRLVK